MRRKALFERSCEGAGVGTFCVCTRVCARAVKTRRVSTLGFVPESRVHP